MPIQDVPLLANEPLLLVLVFLAVLFAYTLFFLLGFGSALLASTPLASVMPVASVIPLLAMLDCSASIARAWRNRQLVDRPALRSLLPFMVVGQFAGVCLLSFLPTPLMAVLLGLFVGSYGVCGILPLQNSWFRQGFANSGACHGLVGGILGGAFGSGGFVYAGFLQRHLVCREAFRATQAVLIGLSTAWRLLLCTLAGLINLELLLLALFLVPAVFFGAVLGRRIDLHLSRSRLQFLLNSLLIASGSGLIIRHIG